MRIHPRDTLVFTSLLVASSGIACRRDLGPVGALEVRSAQLQDLDLSSLAVVGGATMGDALLVFRTPRGDGGAIPVAMGGPQLGVALDLSGDLEGHDGAVPLGLDDADGPVTVADLFGTYRGTKGSLVVGVGVDGRRLRNRHGVTLRESHLALGAGVFFGVEWITLRVGGNDGVELLALDATAATGDTGWAPHTGGPGSVSLPPLEVERVGGCGGGKAPPPSTGSTDDVDTGADEPTGSTGTSDGPEAEPVEAPPSDGGCDGGCGGGCGGAACSTLPAPAGPVALAWWLVFVRRRGRRA